MELGVFKSLILLLLQLAWVTGEEKGRVEIEKGILEKIFLANKFHIYVRPYKTANGTSDEPLEVSVSLYILNLEIGVKKQECSLTMYFRQEWNDSRLSYVDEGKMGVLNVHDAVGFWTPDLFFVNEKVGHLHTLTKPNTFVRIYPEGRVMYSQSTIGNEKFLYFNLNRFNFQPRISDNHQNSYEKRQLKMQSLNMNDAVTYYTNCLGEWVSLKFACSMDLRKYPFDTQICILPIESYGYTAKDLMLKWKPEVTIGTTQPPGFYVSYATEEKIISVGMKNYSRLELGIHFSRQIYLELIHVYIPLGLLVVTSWISFCFRPSVQLPRLTIIFITFFTTLQFLQWSKEFHYSQCYLTASDVWIGFSTFLIFTAFFENVYIMANKSSSSSIDLKMKKDLMTNGEKEKRKLTEFITGKFALEDSNLDAIARMAFPSVFVLFNVVYLAYYLM